MTAIPDFEALRAERNKRVQESHQRLADEHGIPLGSQVSITAESFGPEASEGELVAATRTRYTLRRVDARAGVVHVHFPRIGYVLRKAQA